MNPNTPAARREERYEQIERDARVQLADAYAARGNERAITFLRHLTPFYDRPNKFPTLRGLAPQPLTLEQARSVRETFLNAWPEVRRYLDRIRG